MKALRELPQPGTTEDKWTMATLLPALAQPALHMFVKPTIIEEAAVRMGFEISYQSSPNFRTYKLVLGLAAHLLDKLRPLGARDFIAVYSFLWVVEKYDQPPRK